jgi:hypothetical protein
LTSSVTEPVDLRAARVRKSVHSQEHCPRQACAGQEPAAVAEAQQAFLNLNCPGTLSYVIGDDLGLRDGNWSFAIVADFADAAAYRAYDRDEGHNRARAGLLPMTEQIARVQFEMP